VRRKIAYKHPNLRTVSFTGVVMDVDRIKANSESKDNCYDDWVVFNRGSGMRDSAYEHIIPERLFSTDENPVEGVSTAKALSLAMAQGQKIYTLTKDNKGQLVNITIDDNARLEIS
jgi:predicted lipoprotein with Yx(FWY)xxD motif